jgi:hypothetical protein
MPDGSQQQPEDPAAQRAREQMREWKEQHKDPNAGGWFGNVISSVDGVLAAAEAGQFAVSPDTGAAIIKQLTDVQEKVAEMKVSGTVGGVGQRLGGGYATNIAQFNQKVNEDGMGVILQKFGDELEQLKTAVQRSIANYGGVDSHSRGQIDSAGGGV